MRQRIRNLLQTGSVLLIGAAPALAVAQQAGAQVPAATNAEQPASAATPESENAAAEHGPTTVTVTGTRIVRNGFNAPTPVSVVTAAEIQAAAPTTVADYVNQLPALFGSNAPRTTNTFIGGSLAGANILNLRSLGTTRTLTLFNGRRVTPSFLTGSADVNTLPGALLERVDIVTGGASAAWGSDAVSGVVNFILDTKFTGFKGEIQGGGSTHADASNWTSELSYGTGFAADRGHFLISGRYSKSGTVDARDRDWFQAFKILNNPAFAPGNGQPARLILPHTSLLVNSPGLVASGPLRGLQFGADGKPLAAPFNFGNVVSGTLASGAATDDTADGFEILTPVRQGTLFSRVSYEVTDNLSVFGEATYGSSEAHVTASTFYRTGNVTIPIDNAYLTADVVSRMQAAGVRSFPLSGLYDRFGRPNALNSRDMQRYTAGFDSKLGGTWTMNGYVQYGKASLSNRARDNIMPGRFNLAIDSVLNGAGQIVCRSTLTAPTNGCVSLNPFGTAVPTDAQRAYLFGVASQDMDIREDVAALTVQGDLASLPAGPLSTAFGVEYRREAASATADAASIANQFYVGNYKPFRGSFNVKEAFTEFGIPLLSQTGLGSLDLNLAGRYTDYSTSGSVTTWKAGLSYKPRRDMTLRVTKSRDIRAPNLNELFLGGGTTIGSFTDPFHPGPTFTVFQETIGNPNLKAEVADTLTAGIVYQPDWAPGFSTSVDFYRIKIQDAIFTPSSAQVLSQCFAGDAQSCSLLTRDASGTLTRIRSTPINQRSELARGVDVELGYSREVPSLRRGGAATLDLRALVNYVDALSIFGVLGNIDRVGEVGTNLGAAQGSPRVRALTTVSYSFAPVHLQLKGRYISASKMETEYGPLDVNRNDVPSMFYLDTFLGFDVPNSLGNLQLYVAVDNVLDKAPPVVVSQDGISPVGPGTNLYVYDAVGRMYRVGVQLKF